MTNTKNCLPPFAEEQIIQQKVKLPTNFIELKTVGKNYICSTQGWPKEPVCEQYRFAANGKLVQLDIPHELMEKLGLELGKEITHPIYISSTVLAQKPDEFGGITIKNEKDILLQTEGITLVKEKVTQVDFTSGEITNLKQRLKKAEELSQETQKFLEIVLKDNEEKHIAIIFFEQQIKDLTNRISELRRDLENEILAKKVEENKNKELERVIRELKKQEQVLIGLQNRISDVQNELAGERLIRGRVEQDLQTRTEERDARPNITQGQYGNEVLEYLRQINFLKREINRLNNIIELLEKLAEKELNEKQSNIDNLTTQRDNLQTQVNNLNNQVNNLNGTIRNRDQTIGDLRGEVNNWKNNYNNSQRELSDTKRNYESAQSNYNYYYEQYRSKDREVDNLRIQLSQKENEVSRLNSRIYSINREKNDLEIEKRNLKIELEVANRNISTFKRIVDEEVNDKAIRNGILHKYYLEMVSVGKK